MTEPHKSEKLSFVDRALALAGSVSHARLMPTQARQLNAAAADVREARRVRFREQAKRANFGFSEQAVGRMRRSPVVMTVPAPPKVDPWIADGWQLHPEDKTWFWKWSAEEGHSMKRRDELEVMYSPLTSIPEPPRQDWQEWAEIVESTWGSVCSPVRPAERLLSLVAALPSGTLTCVQAAELRELVAERSRGEGSE